MRMWSWTLNTHLIVSKTGLLPHVWNVTLGVLCACLIVKWDRVVELSDTRTAVGRFESYWCQPSQGVKLILHMEEQVARIATHWWELICDMYVWSCVNFTHAVSQRRKSSKIKKRNSLTCYIIAVERAQFVSLDLCGQMCANVYQ